MSESNTFVYHFFNVYIGVPVAIIGTITSALSLCFFYKDNTTTLGTRLLLSSVALNDIGYLLLRTFYRLKRELTDSESAAWEITLSIIFFSLNVFEMVRNWLVIVIGVERLLLFRSPLDFRRCWTVKAVGLTIGGILAFSVAIRVPSLIFGLPGISKELARTSRMAHLLIECIFFATLPVMLMVLLSMATTFQVRKNVVQRGQLGLDGAAKNYKQISVILKTILWTFMAFSIPCVPSSIFHFYCQYQRACTSPKMDLAEDVVSSMANFFSILNSTSNFFIYIVQSRRYRRTLMEMFRLRFCLKQNHKATVATISK
uniref:G_PROTEIN_RECEP_F1_2 domain-containing protein n=1 Tax=Mesocestoides corti TaxID=53468 RepID=A0A5K3FZ47_MESCO